MTFHPDNDMNQMDMETREPAVPHREVQFRPPGSSADNLDDLSIRLTGEVNRHDFGASGFADLVTMCPLDDLR